MDDRVEWIDRLTCTYDYADDDTPYMLAEVSCISEALLDVLNVFHGSTWAEKSTAVDRVVNDKIIPALREIYDIINEPCWIDQTIDD